MSFNPYPLRSLADLTEELDELVHEADPPEESSCCDACAAETSTVEGISKVKSVRRAKMRGAHVSRLRTAKLRRSY